MRCNCGSPLDSRAGLREGSEYSPFHCSNFSFLTSAAALDPIETVVNTVAEIIATRVVLKET
jgi:hypothetical protein